MSTTCPAFAFQPVSVVFFLWMGRREGGTSARSGESRAHHPPSGNSGGLVPTLGTVPLRPIPGRRLEGGRKPFPQGSSGSTVGHGWDQGFEDFQALPSLQCCCCWIHCSPALLPLHQVLGVFTGFLESIPFIIPYCPIVFHPLFRHCFFGAFQEGPLLALLRAWHIGNFWAALKSGAQYYTAWEAAPSLRVWMPTWERL